MGSLCGFHDTLTVMCGLSRNNPHYASLTRTVQRQRAGFCFLDLVQCGMACDIAVMTSPNARSRGEAIQARLDAAGITKVEFAQHASIDRGTLSRAIADDEKVTDRTYSRIERALAALEHELSMDADSGAVTSTIEYRGARITMAGSPEEVARAIREVLGD